MLGNPLLTSLRSPLATGMGSDNFIPLPIPLPTLWYDIVDISTLTFSGPNVTNVADKGSLGLDVSQSTVGLQPLYNIQQINGLPTVEFDGVDDVLETVSTGLLPSGNPSFTAFCILKLNILGSFERCWGWGISGLNNSAHFAKLDGAQGNRWDFSFFANDYVIVTPGGAITPTLLIWSYEDGFIRKSTALINNSSTFPTSHSHPSVPHIPTPTTFSLGRFLTTMDGAIGEYILYNQLLSLPTIQLVESYLSNKWGI